MTGKNEGGSNVFIYWEQVFNCASQRSFPDSVGGRWCLNHFKLDKLLDLLSPQIYFLHLFLLHVSNITSLCCDIKRDLPCFYQSQYSAEEGFCISSYERFQYCGMGSGATNIPKGFPFPSPASSFPHLLWRDSRSTTQRPGQLQHRTSIGLRQNNQSGSSTKDKGVQSSRENAAK